MKHSNQRDICKSCHLWSLFVCFVGNSLEPYCNAFIKKIIFIAGNRFSWTDCKNCGVSRSIIWLCHLQRLFYSSHHLISFSQQNKLGEHWQLACSIFIIQKVWGLSRPRLLAGLWNWNCSAMKERPGFIWNSFTILAVGWKIVNPDISFQNWLLNWWFIYLVESLNAEFVEMKFWIHLLACQTSVNSLPDCCILKIILFLFCRQSVPFSGLTILIRVGHPWKYFWLKPWIFGQIEQFVFRFCFGSGTEVHFSSHQQTREYISHLNNIDVQ